MSTPATTGPTFADLGLPPLLVQSLNREKITAPFPIQTAAIPDVLAGRDVLGRGPTGSGKTLAFGLPMLVRLAGAPSKPKRPRGLVLAPTRELAAQIEKALDESALALGLRLACVFGGVPTKKQAERLARGVDLLVATPGRLADLLDQGAVSLEDVRVTTVDEADHMAAIGFLPQVTTLLDRTAKDGQRLLFSATLDGEVDELVRRYLREPVLHSTASAVAPVATTEHHMLFVARADKQAVVAEIASRTGRTIMFVRTKEGVDEVAEQLRSVGVVAGALHGGKTQNLRTRTLAAFADGETPVLVATDVAARGIHVDDISLVVHVDPPSEAKDYLHRAGRTGRAGESGTVVTLVTEDERDAVTRLTRKAGVDLVGVEVRPGSRELVALTGAAAPSGVPVPAAEPVTAPPAAPRGPGSRERRQRPGATTVRGGSRRGSGAATPGHRRRGGR
ncbi:DEAD/DEAH box helicase [Rhodococcus tukisamuensis]|uniref:Superfamily II DNA and RNA helicase n=1 Tax=Rhodococcus tukisamuensis TaxID=168276 RepID=A0A1G6UWM6_9NOCA|nr:DEAD/DEAH box helicase [Rhodococcus tukisamuensis]SDD45663.1 Superfamily II DNA and RNA helicase [Rhodococcus tukisamuensis]